MLFIYCRFPSWVHFRSYWEDYIYSRFYRMKGKNKCRRLFSLTMKIRTVSTYHKKGRYISILTIFVNSKDKIFFLVCPSLLRKLRFNSNWSFFFHILTSLILLFAKQMMLSDLTKLPLPNHTHHHHHFLSFSFYSWIFGGYDNI